MFGIPMAFLMQTAQWYHAGALVNLFTLVGSLYCLLWMTSVSSLIVPTHLLASPVMPLFMAVVYSSAGPAVHTPPLAQCMVLSFVGHSIYGLLVYILSTLAHLRRRRTMTHPPAWIRRVVVLVVVAAVMEQILHRCILLSGGRILFFLLLLVVLALLLGTCTDMVQDTALPLAALGWMVVLLGVVPVLVAGEVVLTWQQQSNHHTGDHASVVDLLVCMMAWLFLLRQSRVPQSTGNARALVQFVVVAATTMALQHVEYYRYHHWIYRLVLSWTVWDCVYCCSSWWWTTKQVRS
jgi:hypothetical protein